MNIAYTRYGDFPTLEACTAASTNCHSGYYTSAVGTDAYISKPACWSPTGDNFKPFCKLRMVDDEAQAKKVFEDFGSEFPSAQYWYLMGEWCSRNQDSPYCPNMLNVYVKKNTWLAWFLLGIITALIIVLIVRLAK